MLESCAFTPWTLCSNTAKQAADTKASQTGSPLPKRVVDFFQSDENIGSDTIIV